MAQASTGLIASKYAQDLKDNLKEYHYIDFIEVSSMTQPEFQLDYDELNNYIDFGLNANSFSADDLWFHTNAV